MFLNMSYVFIKNVTELLIFFNKISSFFSAAVGLLIVRIYERVSICASSESNMQILIVRYTVISLVNIYVFLKIGVSYNDLQNL